MSKLKPTLLLSLASLAAVSGAADLNGSDWRLDYRGHYAIAQADVSGLGLNAVLAATLGTQLSLMNGTIVASGTTTLTQNSANSFATSRMEFDASGSSLLLPKVSGLLYNLLDANDGVYSGTLSGNALTLSKPPLASASVDALGVLDTRVAGIGVVVDLRAALPTNSLTGTLDGLASGSGGAYGARGYHVAGTSGLMNTAALQARTTVYTLGVGGIRSTSTGFLDIGAIRTTADAWSLSRSPQAVPEPATMAALGLGTLGALRRRRKG